MMESNIDRLLKQPRNSPEWRALTGLGNPDHQAESSDQMNPSDADRAAALIAENPPTSPVPLRRCCG